MNLDPSLDLLGSVRARFHQGNECLDSVGRAPNEYRASSIKIDETDRSQGVLLWMSRAIDVKSEIPSANFNPS